MVATALATHVVDYWSAQAASSFLPSCCIIKLVGVSLESGVFVVERTFSLQTSAVESGSCCR